MQHTVCDSHAHGDDCLYLRHQQTSISFHIILTMMMMMICGKLLWVKCLKGDEDEEDVDEDSNTAQGMMMVLLVLEDVIPNDQKDADPDEV